MTPLTTGSPSTDSLPTDPLGRSASDLQEHLVLVGHVLQELSLRIPARFDRGAMFNHGAMGLLVASRRTTTLDADFSGQALRSVRATMIGNLASRAPAPADPEIAALLGMSATSFKEEREAWMARVSTQDTGTARQATPTTSSVSTYAPMGRAARPVFIGA